MLFSNTAEKPASLTETQQMTRDAGRFMARKIWLPKVVYDTLPYFYLIAGIGALLTTFYISGWAWLLPHGVTELLAFVAAFALRASAIVFDIRMGPPGQFIRIGKADQGSE